MQTLLCFANDQFFEKSLKRSHRVFVHLVACACVADISFPFSRHGDQSSEGANERVVSNKWGEVGRGEQNKKGEGGEIGRERN